MKEIERNDVDVSKLFQWHNEFNLSIPTATQPIKIYMRLVGDAELNRARVYAVRKSAELRRKFKDEDSDEYFAFIEDIDLIDKEQLVAFVVLQETQHLYIEASKEVTVKKPKELSSDASLEEQEIFQAEVDAYPVKVHQAVTEYIRKKIEKYEKEVRAKSKEELYEIYKKMLIDSVCENQMYASFKDMCVYFSVYSDKEMTKRLFDTFEEFDNLPTVVKQNLHTYYDTLELGYDELKK